MTYLKHAFKGPDNDWRHSDYARQYYAAERSFLDAGLRQSVGPSVLQLGSNLDQTILEDLELPFMLKASFNVNDAADLVVDPAFLPFSPEAFSTVVLPHVLETHALPHQILRESHRVLQSEGHIVLTGFNPHSLMSLQRFLHPSAVCAGRYYSVRRVIDWLQLLGFEVVASSMFQYAPLSKRDGVIKALSILETIGQHWLPMVGGGYMISAKKRDMAYTKVGRIRFRRQQSKLIPAAAKTTFSETSQNQET